MKPTGKPPHDPIAAPATAPADESPGVPGFRTWRGVYLFVIGAFVAMVAGLAAFTHVFA